MSTAKKTTTKTTAAKKTAASASKTANQAAKTVEATAEDSVKAAGQTFKDVTETATKSAEKAYTTVKDQFESAMKNVTGYSSLGRENVEAFVTAGRTAAKGAETLNSELMAISKRNIDESVAAAKALSSAKSPKEFFELQSDLYKSAWDNYVADTSKIAKIVSDSSKDVFAPISDRISKTAEEIQKPLSA